MIDILQKIIDGELTEAQAYDVMDSLIAKHNNGEIKSQPFDEMCLDKYEWTAIAYAVNLLTLVNWRQHGWPESCSVCGAKIDYKKGGWIAKDNKLVGVNCHD